MKKALVAEDNANAQGKEGSRLNRFLGHSFAVFKFPFERRLFSR